MLKWIFDFSTGFRFSKISVECSVHICSCPWPNSLLRSKNQVATCHKRALIPSKVQHSQLISSEGKVNYFTLWLCVDFMEIKEKRSLKAHYRGQLALKENGFLLRILTTICPKKVVCFAYCCTFVDFMKNCYTIIDCPWKLFSRGQLALKRKLFSSYFPTSQCSEFENSFGNCVDDTIKLFCILSGL